MGTGLREKIMLRIKREPLLLLAPGVLALAAAFAFPIGQVLWLAVHDLSLIHI